MLALVWLTARQPPVLKPTRECHWQGIGQLHKNASCPKTKLVIVKNWPYDLLESHFGDSHREQKRMGLNTKNQHSTKSLGCLLAFRSAEQMLIPRGAHFDGSSFPTHTERLERSGEVHQFSGAQPRDPEAPATPEEKTRMKHHCTNKLSPKVKAQ